MPSDDNNQVPPPPPADNQAYESPDEDRRDSVSPTESLLEESAAAGHDPYAALRIPNYRYYMSGNLVSIIGSQMTAFVMAYQLYRLTNSTTAMGLVGLVQVLPILMLTLLAGSVIDRFSRKAIILIDQGMLVLSATSLGAVTLFHDRIPPMALLDSANHALSQLADRTGETTHHFNDRVIQVMFGLLFVNGTIRSFNQPAKQSLLPMLVPQAAFHNAITWNSSVFETCTMIGPMLAGFVVSFLQARQVSDATTFAGLYFFNALCQLTMLLVFLPIRLTPLAQAREPISVRSLLAGIRFVRDTRIILATLSLDMFAVLLGGATALLPVIADRVLGVGPLGLGVLRAAPSVGAILMAVIVAHSRPSLHPGRGLLWATAGFGIATMAFGLSLSFPLSVVALFLTGMFDNISVVTRHSLVQILTPNAMRGRVSAVNSLFISTSNEIGELESGLTASVAVGIGGPFFGPMAAIIAGGIGSILVVLGVNAHWPEVRRLGPIADLRALGPKID